MDTKALREQRKKLAEQANEILATAVREGRAATSDEIQKVDAIHADIDALKATIDRAERASDEARSIVPESQRVAPAAEGDVAAELRKGAFGKWLRGGFTALSTEEVRALGNVSREHGAAGFTIDMRAQSVGTTTAGGYTVAQAFSNSLERALKFFGGMLQVADVVTTDTGATLPWPTVNDTAQTGAILAENTAVSNQDITFSVVNLGAYKYSSKQVLVSVELMQDSAFDIDSLVGSLLGERLGRILNTHFTTGTGTSQPNGVVTAATLGKTGTTGQTTSVIYDDLVDLVHSVDIAYRQNGNCRWMLNDASVKVIRKIKDSTGQPIWAPGMQAGQPDTLLGFPISTNNDVATMAANAKSILFGDFTKYKVRRVKDITILRLNERYADAHQVGFLGFCRFDGNLIDAGTNPVKYYANSAT